MAPAYLCHIIHVLPPSKYNLRRNPDPGVLLPSPEIRTNLVICGTSHLVVPPLDFGTFFHLIRDLFFTLNIFKN